MSSVLMSNPRIESSLSAVTRKNTRILIFIWSRAILVTRVFFIFEPGSIIAKLDEVCYEDSGQPHSNKPPWWLSLPDRLDSTTTSTYGRRGCHKKQNLLASKKTYFWRNILSLTLMLLKHVLILSSWINGYFRLLSLSFNCYYHVSNQEEDGQRWA